MNFSCAFPNTPKFTQVKQTGKGFVVGKQWILDCYKQEQLLSEKNYELKGTNNTPGKKESTNRTSGRNITNFDEKDEPVMSKDVTKKPTLKKKMTTFDDDDDDEDEEPVITKNTKENKKIITFDDDDEEPVITKNGKGNKKITTVDEGNFDFKSVFHSSVFIFSI